MSKLKFTVILSLTFAYPLCAEHITLNSLILTHADGRFPIGINGEVVALIKQYQGHITTLLRGKKTRFGYEGIFDFEGKKWTVQELRELESTRGINHHLATARHKVIEHFQHISQPFRQLIGEFGIKPLMAELIAESMAKRERPESLLYVWAKMDEQHEQELFDTHIKSMQDLEFFMIDLNNFLGDIVYNCPRGYAQYKEHLEKFNKVVPFLKELRLGKEQRELFLKYVNKKLFTIAKNDISLEKVQELYNEFKR